MSFSSIETIFTKVALTVEQAVCVDRSTLSPATRLVEDLQLGRFARLRLIVSLEENFRMELSDEAVAGFRTLGDIARHISRWWLQTFDDAFPVADLRHDDRANRSWSRKTALSWQMIRRWLRGVAAFVGASQVERLLHGDR